MSRRVSQLGVWIGLAGGLLAADAGAQPLAYVLVHPGSAEGSTQLGLLDLASGDLERIGPLGVTLTDAYLTSSPDGSLYAVDFFRLGVPEPRIEIHRLDRETGAAIPIAQREFGEPVLFLRGLTADALGNLWLLVNQGPSVERYLMFRFEIASRALIREGSMIGSFRGLAHRGGLLWTIHSPTQPSAAALPMDSPSGRFLSTVDPVTRAIVPQAPIEEIIEPGLSFDDHGQLWGLLSRSVPIAPPGFRVEGLRIDTFTGQVESLSNRLRTLEIVSPGSLAVLPGGTAVPAVPTLRGGALILLAVVLLGIGVRRLHCGIP